GGAFYFILTGKPPFEGTVAQRLRVNPVQPPTPVRDLRPDVPQDLAQVVDRMLAMDPEERYQTPAEVCEALQAWTKRAPPLPPEVDLHRLSPAALGTLSATGASGKVSPAATAAAVLPRSTPRPSRKALPKKSANQATPPLKPEPTKQATKAKPQPSPQGL